MSGYETNKVRGGWEGSQSESCKGPSSVPGTEQTLRQGLGCRGTVMVVVKVIAARATALAAVPTSGQTRGAN